LGGRLDELSNLPHKTAERVSMKTVGIVGVGLIGGSFGLALRAAGFTGEILGVSSPAAVAAGIARGAISAAATLREAAARADLLYLSQPVDRILDTLDSLVGMARPDCLITDAGSTKQEIVRRSAGLSFLGGHPLAGKERRGMEAAEASLFRDRPYVLTPAAPPTPATREFRGWLEKFGAHVIEMSPPEHDSAVAFTSHLPQLVSTALAATLNQHPKDKLEKVVGPGLLDMTRLAMSAPDLWLSILSTNRVDVLKALDEYQETLKTVRKALAASNLADLFQAGSAFALKIRT
jgi:prephenate dehydrogenase